MAFYNNGFPATYQNPYMAQPVQYQAQQQNGIIWVQGEAGAKSYLVAPNNTVQLWDSESQTIYLKSADASGMPSMKVLNYTIRDNGVLSTSGGVLQQPNNLSAYATKDEIKALSNEITKLRTDIDALNSKKGDTDHE